jgi:hypothetical protein
MRNAHASSGSFITFVLASLVPISSCGGTSQQPPPPPPRATQYYLDCSLQTGGDGTQNSPWNSLTSANAFAFQPGDTLLFKHGSTCSGSFIPTASGASGKPIVVDAYGTGPQPILDGGMNEAAVKLFDVQYWELNNLEIAGGDYWGIFVRMNQGNSVMNHVYLKNLNVHGAHHQVVGQGDSGEIHIECPVSNNTYCNDILIDGVTVHDSTASDGISVSGWPNSATTPFDTNITVQNSTVHDVGGQGILLLQVRNGMIQNNVVYNTGLCSGCNFSSGGIVYVSCQKCVMQNNESYANKTPVTLYDGGDFDLEDSIDSMVQYNYGHDSAGYCLSHFPGSYTTPTNNVFRYNVCSNNGQVSSLSYQGELILNTGGGNPDNGIQIYNNTFYWNPAGAGPVISMENARYTGTNPNLSKNNILYSASSDMVYATSGLNLDNNVYWTISGDTPTWKIDGNIYVSLSAHQAGTGQDSHSSAVDPIMLNPTYHDVGRPITAFTLQPGSPAAGSGADVCNGVPGCSMGNRDFWGNPLPNGSGYSIGAYQPPPK